MFRVIVLMGYDRKGVNTRMGATLEPTSLDCSVSEMKLAINPVIAGNVPLVVASMMTGGKAYRSFDVPAATLVKAACAFNGVGNDCKKTVMRSNALNLAPYRITFKTNPAEEGFELTKQFVYDPADVAATLQGLLI